MVMCMARMGFSIDMDLNFKTYGQGPALIILHGLFGSLDNWVSHARQLADSFSVYLVDQRNHGKSPHDPEWEYAVMAEDLHEFMDDHGIFQAHLLGHSMGGKTVMKFAGEYPERVEKLIVADMAPVHYAPHHLETIAALNAVPVRKIASRQDADKLLAQRIEEIGVRQFLLKSLVRDPEGGFRWKFNLEVITQKYEAALEAIPLDFPFDKPTLFVSGGRSEYMIPAYHEQIREDFPDAEFQIIPEAGHWLHAEAPVRFLEIVRSFLG